VVTGDRVGVGEIADMLALRAQALAAELLPGGRREGREWACGSVAGEPGKSLRMVLAGPKRGFWRDFAADQSGDPLDLVEQVLGLDKGAAVAWAKSWLGLSDEAPRRPARPAAAEPPDVAETREADARWMAAIDIWRSCRPATRGSEVAIYLAGRGITLPAPPSLRWSLGLWHGPSRRIWPAMVAGVQAGTGDRGGAPVAVHRTFLAPGGAGKAPVTPSKMMLGGVRGGAVRLAPASGPRLAIAEGIETGLSIQQECPDLPVWCGLSVGGMAAMVLPDHVRELVLCTDGDRVGSRAFFTAVERVQMHHAAQGRVVWTQQKRLPEGLDHNDLVRAAGRAGGVAA